MDVKPLGHCGSRPTKTVGDQPFERPVILRHRQARIIRARPRAPEGLRRTGCQQAAQVHRFTVHGRTTAAGAVVKGERNIPWELCRHQLIVERVRFGGVGEAGIPAPVVVGEGVVEDSGAYLQ
jgi:hypothetical protein